MRGLGENIDIAVNQRCQLACSPAVQTYASFAERCRFQPLRTGAIARKTLALQALVPIKATAPLAACANPISYRAGVADGTTSGYTDNKRFDQVCRMRFQDHGRKLCPWSNFFLRYRSAEVARSSDATGVQITEGKVDASVLSGEVIFGWRDRPGAGATAMVLTKRTVYEGDTVVGYLDREDTTHRTACHVNVPGAVVNA